MGLVITRNERERVFIGPEVVVEVVWAARGRVRLKITAPVSVDIWREEIRPGEWANPDAGGEPSPQPDHPGGADPAVASVRRRS